MDKSILNKQVQQPNQNILANVCAMAASMDDVINLSVGDPNFKTPQPIIDFAFKKTSAGMTHYTAANGLPELRQALCDYYQQQYSLVYNSDQVLITVGAQHGMFLALETILDPGDEVIIPQPSYSPYVNQVKLAGGKAVIVNCQATNNFSINTDDIAAKITDRTKAIIINTPNNPTGHLMTESEMKGLAQLAIQHNLLILSDEIYSDYVMPGKHFMTMAKYAPNNVVINSGMSKCFAMTGWRLGYLIGPDWLIDAANEINDAICYVAPTMSQEAAFYGLQHHDEMTNPIVNAFCKRLAYLKDSLDHIDWLTAMPVDGSIYLFVDMRKTGLNSVDFANYLLQKAGILVVPGLAFGPAGEGFIRIAATQPLATIQKAVQKLNTLDLKEA